MLKRPYDSHLRRTVWPLKTKADLTFDKELQVFEDWWLAEEASMSGTIKPAMQNIRKFLGLLEVPTVNLSGRMNFLRGSIES